MYLIIFQMFLIFNDKPLLNLEFQLEFNVEMINKNLIRNLS